MSNPRIWILTTLAGAVLAANAQAQTMAPGLWEHTFSVKSRSGQMEGALARMQQELAKMPPEQRQRMQAMMAAQGTTLGPKGNTSRICLSKERAARADMPLQDDDDCTQQTVSRSGSTIKFKFACSGTPASSGEGEYTLTGDKAYRGHAVMNTTVQGKPDRIEMQQSGQWISADCGAIKPR